MNPDPVSPSGSPNHLPAIPVPLSVAEDAASIRVAAREWWKLADARIAQLLEEERRARAEAEAAAARDAFLAEAGGLLASSLDYETTLGSVAELAVARLADWCVVDILDDDGGLRRLAVAHADPAKIPLAWELYERFPPQPSGTSGVYDVLATREPKLVAEVTDEMLVAIARGEEHLAMLRAFGLTSYMIVPLLARDRLLGAISFALGEGGRRFTEADLGLAVRLAWKAALAVDNARLFRDAEAAVRRKDEMLAEWKRAEEAVRQTQKLESIGLLAGGIAHDFNNLLTGILGNASLARRVLPPGSPADPMLADVVRASERAAALTSQLLAYAGKGRFFVQPVDLAKLVRDISGLIRTSIPKKVEVRREIDAELPPVEADAGQLQQVVMNLVINGAEAIGDAPGMVTIRAHGEEVGAAELQARFAAFNLSSGPYVRLEVRDTGSGMDAATQARIYDPFFTTKFTGRGLGLAAVLGIIRGHKGGIAVDSAPGRGTTFTVLLPALRAAPAPEPRRADQSAHHGSGTVLVADDEEIVRRAARAALEVCGYAVLEATTGVEAIDLVRRHGDEIVLVLLDMTMPIMSGDEAVRHLKRLRPGLPVLATSGYGELEAVRRFTGTGVDGFLQKPYTSEELVGRLDAMLAER